MKLFQPLAFSFQPSQPVGGLLDWLTGTDEEIERGRQLDEQLKLENQKLADRGVWSQEQVNQANARIDANGAETYSQQVLDEFTGTLQSEAEQAVQTALDTVEYIPRLAENALSTIAKKTAGGILGAIPWWVWIGGGVLIFLAVRQVPRVSGYLDRQRKENLELAKSILPLIPK